MENTFVAALPAFRVEDVRGFEKEVKTLIFPQGYTAIRPEGELVVEKALQGV